MIVMHATRSRCAANRFPCEFTLLGKVGNIAVSQLLERIFRSGAQRKDSNRRARIGRLLACEQGGLLDDHVRVDAAQSERTDSREPRLFGARPIDESISDLHRDILPVDTWIGVMKVQLAWYLLVLHCQHHLDQPSHSGSRLEVTDVGLHRTDEDRLISVCS